MSSKRPLETVSSESPVTAAATGSEVAPYSALAHWYDTVMDHVDYVGWARTVERLWAEHGLSPKCILETAAGTARLAPFLHRPGRRHVATDLSLSMLRIARGRSAEVAVADFCRLPFLPSTFDAMLCLYDAVNYCMDEDQLQAFFGEAFRVLAPGGALLLDATTSANSCRNFLDERDHEVIRGCDVLRHSWYDVAARLQHNDFIFFEPGPDGRFSRKEEHHTQRIWAITEFRKAAKAAGLVWMGAWDESMSVPSTRSERIHLLLCRPE